nr:MAG TPA: hypothetical protein [Caudoviricetes sp.]
MPYAEIKALFYKVLRGDNNGRSAAYPNGRYIDYKGTAGNRRMDSQNFYRNIEKICLRRNSTNFWKWFVFKTT